MLLSLEALALERGGRLLFEGLSLQLGVGEQLSVLAPNGAGKTSLFMVLAGLLAPTGGTCRLAGLDIVTRRDEALAHVGYVPSRVSVWPGYTVRAFLEALASLRGLKRAPARDAAQEVMASCDLASHATIPVETLSGGYLKRLGLAQALVHNPAILLLDELSSGLDHGSRQSIFALCDKLAKNRVIISATHHFEEATETALLFLPQGKLPLVYTADSARETAAIKALWERSYGSVVV